VITQLLNPEGIGRIVLSAVRYVHGFYALSSHALKRIGMLRIVPVRRVFLKQIYFTGIQSLGAITLIAILSGFVVTTQIASLIGSDTALIAKILLWTLVRELGPLLAAIVVIARTSSATSSELANMKIHDELNSLRIMGIDPLNYLIVPRITGISLAVVAVTFYFQITAIMAGLIFASVMREFALLNTLSHVVSLLSLTEVSVSVVKSLTFGLVISVTSCLYGLRAPLSVTAVPRAATRAVMGSLTTVFILNGLISYLVFL
jgi:phospholipid/cholesterol/gamma-HCH transport system permease protein